MINLRLTSFLGVEFGTDIIKAKEKILTREGAILDTKNSNENTLFFDGVTFGGRQTSYIYLSFVGNKFAKGEVFISPKLDAFAINLYKEIKAEINLKYFKAQSDYEIFQEPYYENDGYTESGIRSGKIIFSAYWEFVDGNGGEKDFISINIDEDMKIRIAYEDGDLIKELIDKSSKENAEDY